MDFMDIYVSGSGMAQVLLGFSFFAGFFQKKGKPYFYFLFAVCGGAVVCLLPNGGLSEYAAFFLLLAVSGIWICHEDWKSAVLYAALVVEVMQLCYGIVYSLSSLCYPHLSILEGSARGLVFMLAGEAVSLVMSGVCCRLVYRYFSCCGTEKKQYVFMVLIPVLMLFFMEKYINSTLYSVNVTYGDGIMVYTNHGQLLAVQVLGMASLFCILFAYKRLLQNLRLSTELSLLEQEEHYLNQYVEEAKARYERTASFRHDVRNHMAVLKKLLQSGNSEQAAQYIGDMEEMAEALSFPCSTNNPVVDILVGNKLGIAESMGIAVNCSLLLPYPCGLRDIDVCIILSNALDNAIHACKNMDEGAERYIRMTGRMQGDFLLMEIENSYRKKGMPKEGTGMSNIRAVAEKYQGAVSVKTQGQAFLLHVLLIIPRHSESISRQMDSSGEGCGRKRN